MTQINVGELTLLELVELMHMVADEVLLRTMESEADGLENHSISGQI